ncbi:MAG: PAS domain-containing protein [Deltaproteobacteria bacterium]|nr:PAS domain-containing protein [Deltaproteobacteria bacterium]
MERYNIHENIIESLGEGLLGVDNSLQITVFNQAAERLTGVSSSIALNKPLTEIFQKDRWLYDIIDKTIKENKVFSEYEGSVFQRFGSTRAVSVTTAPMLDAKGNISGAVITIKDISHIKPIEQDTARTERLAFIGAFAANLAHEVKNPLGGIRGAAQLLSRRLKEKEHTEYTDLIIRESDRLNKLLEDILDFSNPRNLNIAPRNIHKILDNVISIQNYTALEKGINIIKEYDPSIPSILGDNEQLTQVFLNIIKNSIEAIKDSGEVKILTRIVTDFHLVEKGYAGGNIAEIEIRDTGFGIPEENLEKIFTPFFTTKKRGSGLGLAISLKIIKEHGGFFKIESIHAKGTVVSVLLPIAKEEEAGNE